MLEKIRRLNWQLYLRLGISGVLICWFVMAYDWRQIIDTLAGVSLGWISLAVVWILAAMLVSTVKWRIILNAQGIAFSFKQLWRTYWMGLFFNNFLPSSIGGDALRVLRVGKETGDHAGATASVVIERMLAAAGLSIVGLVASLMVADRRWELTAMFVILLLMMLGLLGLLMAAKVPGWISKRENRWSRFLVGIAQHGQVVRTRPRALGTALLWSILFQTCVVGVNYALFHGLGISLTWFQALYVVPAISVLSMIPLGINGYGIREGAYIVLLGAYGVTEVAAFTASILFAFLVSICSLYGGLLWLWEKKFGLAGLEKQTEV